MHNGSIYWRWKQIYTKEMESWLNVATAGHKHLNAFSELMESPTSEPSTLRASLPVSVQYKQQSVLRTVQKTLETLVISKLATHTAFLKIKLHNINTVHKTQQSQIWARHGTAPQELHCACSAMCMLCVQFKATARMHIETWAGTARNAWVITNFTFHLFVFPFFGQSLM